MHFSGWLSTPVVTSPPQPHSGTPGTGAGMLVWAHKWGEEMVPISKITGFLSHRSEFKCSLRICWSCDLGQST